MTELLWRQFVDSLDDETEEDERVACTVATEEKGDTVILELPRDVFDKMMAVLVSVLTPTTPHT